MKLTYHIPFFVKIAFLSIGIIGIVYTLHLTQRIVIPLVFAAIIAVLINPIINFLTRKGWNRFFAIVTTVAIAFLILVVLSYILAIQVSHFGSSFSEMGSRLQELIDSGVSWIALQTDTQTRVIQNWIEGSWNDQLNDLAVKESLGQFGQALLSTLLLPVYIVMILYYKPILVGFTRGMFRSKDQTAVEEVLASVKSIIQSYLVGLFIEVLIVAVMNSVGLLIIGMQYAILLGVLGALLNIIPYLGAIIAASIFMLIALLTKTPLHMLYVLVMYLIIQFVDNNFILPKVVASRVKINALVSIVGVILGGTFWGVSGMFLAIPLTAIAKVIFDHIPTMKPWGVLLGDTMPK
jgi:predicted PurR-regulated permease PerM